MLRRKLMSAVIVLGISFTPAVAQAESSFRGDGKTFKYSTVAEDKGIRLTGVVLETGEKFDLLLDRYGYVDGQFGLSAVSFRVDKGMRDRVAAEMLRADRPATAAAVGNP